VLDTLIKGQRISDENWKSVPHLNLIEFLEFDSALDSIQD
jgi:hypothetical protein